MVYLTIYRWRPENRKAIVQRFMETGGVPPPGVKLLSRWTDVAGGRGFSLTEADDPVAASKFAYAWNDLMSFEMVPVVSDEQLGQVLAG
ncbi:MAG: DUF3303 family protein [Burkholderiaceae bacterium]